MKIIGLHTDDSADDPSDFEGAWKLYSFNRRHRSFKDPASFTNDNGKTLPGLRSKLRVGLAFVLDYYEHGACQWSRTSNGPECQFDTAHRAGLLVWERKPKEIGAKTLEARAVDADAFLATYNAWCNGEVYGYSVDEEVTLSCGHTERRPGDSCFGFYGNDLKYMGDEIRAALAGDAEFRFEGDADFLKDSLGLRGQ